MKYFSRSHNNDKNLRPPDLYEYFVDNFWFKAADLENQKINEPLRGSHKADVVIVGGGYTGLSAAYHIREKFPDKEVLLVEGACCGYGASGRNGGFCIATDLIRNLESDDPEAEAFHGLRLSLFRDLVMTAGVFFIYGWRRYRKIRPVGVMVIVNHLFSKRGKENAYV